MSLGNIADRLDAALDEADTYVAQHRAEIVEQDAHRMAHYIFRHVMESAPVGTDPYAIGQALVQGAVIGEDDSGGELVNPVIAFMESVLAGARSVTERFGGDDTGVYDPVSHAAQYYITHGKWPESASSGVIAKARAAVNSSKIAGTFL